MATPKKAPDAVAVVKAFNALESAKLAEANTARLTALTGFLIGFASSPGLTATVGFDVRQVDEDSPAHLIEARAAAVLAAFHAVEKIALQ